MTNLQPNPSRTPEMSQERVGIGWRPKRTHIIYQEPFTQPRQGSWPWKRWRPLVTNSKAIISPKGFTCKRRRRPVYLCYPATYVPTQATQGLVWRRGGQVLFCGHCWPWVWKTHTRGAAKWKNKFKTTLQLLKLKRFGLAEEDWSCSAHCWPWIGKTNISLEQKAIHWREISMREHLQFSLNASFFKNWTSTTNIFTSLCFKLPI